MPEIVGLEQQQGLIVAAFRRFAHGAIEFREAVRTIVQIGDQILRAQHVEFFRKLHAHGLLTEDNLLTRFAFVAGFSEFHRRVERGAIAALRFQVQFLRRFFAFRQSPQQRFEIVRIVGRDHVENRHALNFFEILETENFQICFVRADMHAFVHVGDRVAR